MTSEIHKRRGKRITVKPKKSPNPLFEKWLEEWKNEAVSKGSDMQYCFGKALSSLRKYPLPLQSGRDCGVLDYFGNRLCIMLDRKLAEYRKNYPEGAEDRGDDMATLDTSSSLASISSLNKPQKKKKKKNESSSNVEGVRKKRPYLPSRQSGPYAILLTLLAESQKPNYPGYLTKSQLEVLAQPLCDTSFRKRDPGSFYNAWSCMSGLVKRGLVLRNGCPAKFNLSDAGTDIARQLQDMDDTVCPNSTSSESTATGNGNISAILTADPEEYRNFSAATSVKRKTTAAKNTEHDNCHNLVQAAKISHRRKCSKVPPLQQEAADSTAILVPGSFDVILLVDKQETAGASRPDRLLQDATVAELSVLGTLFELRHLKVSDFMWVCRERATGQELVLPYIVERKRMDDLAKSIRDGRFHEQKFRMKQSRVQNLIYLVESHGDNMHTTLPLETLNQATINTQVVDKFSVKMTSSHRDTMRYLSVMTSLLSATYCTKTIFSCRRDSLPHCDINDDVVSLMTFSEFNNTSSKTKALSVQDLFMKQLVQLHGLSVQKAQAIVERYHTPRVLMAAYQDEGSAGDRLLADIRYGSLNRLIGPVISRTIHQFYTKLLLS